MISYDRIFSSLDKTHHLHIYETDNMLQGHGNNSHNL